MRKFWKGAVVILVSVILLSTIVSAANIKNEKEKMVETSSGRRVVWYNYPHQEDSVESLFYPSSEDWGSYVADNLFGFNEFVTQVKWWGISKDSTNQPCDPTGMLFHIFFFENDHGEPGDTTAMYTSIVPDTYDTGRIYENHYPLWEFTFQLNPGVQLNDHWIALFSAGSPYGAIFFWSNAWGTGDALMYPSGNPISDSVAFELSKDYPTDPVSKLKHWTYIEWRGSKANEYVYAMVDIENYGDPGSILDWEITEWPNWGSDWSFNPMDGDYLLLGDSQDIYIQMKAPNTWGREKYGKIKVINTRDPPDYIEIEVVLSTYKSKEKNNPFINYLTNHQNMFPMLRQLIQRLGV